MYYLRLVYKIINFNTTKREHNLISQIYKRKCKHITEIMISKIITLNIYSIRIKGKCLQSDKVLITKEYTLGSHRTCF